MCWLRSLKSRRYENLTTAIPSIFNILLYDCCVYCGLDSLFCVVAYCWTQVMGLTIKQEKFCNLYIELGNASEAYRQSYSTKKMSEKQVWEEASKLINSPKVTQRINGLRSELASRHNITKDDLVKELAETRKVALSLENPQCSAAIAATMGTAKLLGFIDKKEENKDKDDLASALIKLIDKMPN
jgi:phage terminase small subunit